MHRVLDQMDLPYGGRCRTHSRRVLIKKSVVKLSRFKLIITTVWLSKVTWNFRMLIITVMFSSSKWRIKQIKASDQLNFVWCWVPYVTYIHKPIFVQSFSMHQSVLLDNFFIIVAFITYFLLLFFSADLVCVASSLVCSLFVHSMVVVRCSVPYTLIYVVWMRVNVRCDLCRAFALNLAYDCYNITLSMYRVLVYAPLHKSQ